jgi:predicted nuclease of restriction endonuclease-like (RecB) superfamily
MNKKLATKSSTITTLDHKRIESLYKRVVKYINNARHIVQKTVDTEMVAAYWLIGKDIIEEEQKGQKRAEYGKLVLSALADRLTEKYGRGFSVSTLRDIRQFYIVYNDYCQIHHAVRGESKKLFSSNLGWIHYRALMRISRREARYFYEIEAEKNHWSGRELERQIDSLLFERLAKSKDKKGLMKLACKGQEINRPEDAIKEPMILEFLNLPESHRLVESKLEEALTNNLQNFLLELGKGFAFIARQKRLTLDGDHFYADLVFYHVILKCYVIIDIKTKKLTHSDLGQMLLYANYFDQEVKMESDNPTIGLILCTKKSDSMVKYLLGDKAKQVFASTYKFHLPTEKELETEIKREVKEIKHQLLKKDKKK